MKKRIVLILTIALAGAMPFSARAQWTGPTQAPPAGNVSQATLTTVTTGSGANTTSNGITINGFINNGGSYFVGNVGIGTVTPAAALQVTKASYMQEGAITNPTGIGIGVQGTSPRISFDNGAGAANVAGNQWNIDNNAGLLRFFTAGNVRQVVTPGGNVGIATSSPLTALAVAGQITTTGGIRFNDGTTQSSAAGASQWTTSGNNIYNANSGNVGIGVTNPGTALEVRQASAVDGADLVRVMNTTASKGAGIRLDNSFGTNIFWGLKAFNSGNLGIVYLGDTEANADVTFASNGNVGIGSPTPAARLDINAGTSDGIRVSVSGSTQQVFRFGNSGTTKIGGIINSGSGQIQLADNAGTTNVNLIGSGSSYINGGNVGIATSSPLTTLAVGGTITTTGGVRFADGTTQTTATGAQTLQAVTNVGTTTTNAISVQGIKIGTGAGNFTTNIAIGDKTLQSNVGGTNNTALGWGALMSLNGSGAQSQSNTAVGQGALGGVTLGTGNTAVGASAFGALTTGYYNTAVGYNTYISPSLTKSTAIGYNANVAVSNGMVLGGTGVDAVNVGIGTTSPAFALDVNGDINYTGTLRQNGFAVSMGGGTLSGSGSTGYIPKWTSSTGLGNSLVYDSTVGVGIGTASPGIYKLNVAGDSYMNNLYLTNTGGVFDSTSQSGMVVRAAGNLDLWNGASAKVSIQTNGNVGIGVTAPNQKLDVNGNIRVYNAGVSAGYVYSDGSNYGLLNNLGSWALYVPNGTQNVYAPGAMYSTAFYYSSDKNLKKNILPLKGSDSLKKIMSLQGVSFDWKKDDKASVGLIAQDVEKVYPELVSTDKATGLKSVEYGNLVGPLIEAVKEQQKEIEALRAEVEALKAK